MGFYVTSFSNLFADYYHTNSSWLEKFSGRGGISFAIMAFVWSWQMTSCIWIVHESNLPLSLHPLNIYNMILYLRVYLHHYLNHLNDELNGLWVWVLQNHDDSFLLIANILNTLNKQSFISAIYGKYTNSPQKHNNSLN